MKDNSENVGVEGGSSAICTLPWPGEEVERGNGDSIVVFVAVALKVDEVQ